MKRIIAVLAVVAILAGISVEAASAKSTTLHYRYWNVPSLSYTIGVGSNSLPFINEFFRGFFKGGTVAHAKGYYTSYRPAYAPRCAWLYEDDYADVSALIVFYFKSYGSRQRAVCAAVGRLYATYSNVSRVK